MALPAYPNSLSFSQIFAQFGNTTPPYSLSSLYATKTRQTVNISWLTDGDVSEYDFTPSRLIFGISGDVTASNGTGGISVAGPPAAFLTNGDAQLRWIDNIGGTFYLNYTRTSGSATASATGLDLSTGPLYISAARGYASAGTTYGIYTIWISSDVAGTVILSQATNVRVSVTQAGDSVSARAYMPGSSKPAGAFIPGDALVLLSEDRLGTKPGVVISNRLSDDVALITLVSETGIRLTCSDNTPLTLQDGSYLNSAEALGHKLPVEDQNGFRWETIVQVLDAGRGQVATIYCDEQCYAAGDQDGKYIWTHNAQNIKP